MNEKQATVTAKLPIDLYKELTLRIPDGERSNFIRDAITEKLDKTPRPDKMTQLEQKINKLEAELTNIKRLLTELEVLTFEKDKVNPHTFCIDETDHKIVNHLLNYKGATTPELAEALKTNRWQMLNRLRRIQNRSKKQLGKPVIEYYAGERSGKKKAWWISQELIEET
jgi:hypothetical protein